MGIFKPNKKFVTRKPSLKVKEPVISKKTTPRKMAPQQNKLTVKANKKPASPSGNIKRKKNTHIDNYEDAFE